MVGTNLKFVHVGYEYVLCANRIVAVFPTNSGPTRRMMRFAKTNDSYIDMSKGRETRSYILLEDGSLVGCAFNPVTILRRLNEVSPMGGFALTQIDALDIENDSKDIELDDEEDIDEE